MCYALAGLLLIANAAPADRPADLDAGLEGLRQADVRLGAVLFRLARANDELCQKHAALTGMVLHASEDYVAAVRPEVVRYFHLATPIGVEGVVSDGPAARAGVLADDSIVSIDGKPVGANTTRAEALAEIDSTQGNEGVSLDLSRDGHRRMVEIQPVRGCEANAEVDVSDDANAFTDGKIIQVDSALVNLVGDDDQALAAIVAHELAHIVLDHPDRLTAAHVSRGLFKGFGRSARLFKQTENEADRLSVTLMANAGYDPRAAVRYWLTYGPRLDAHRGLGSTHLSWRDRAKLIGEEVARVEQEPQRPIIPNWINSRSEPLR